MLNRAKVASEAGMLKGYREARYADLRYRGRPERGKNEAAFQLMKRREVITALL
jgi:hypothetical protein